MITLSSYAPVMIPTLCRYEHFKRCIESLAANVGANRTEVFVALDYPLKDAHWVGYNKIKDYLYTTQLGFKSLTVFEREENYGVRRNGRTLRDYIFERYDRVIYSEDDNEFSPNFLLYINQGLDLYENDPKINSICGYNYDINTQYLKENHYFSYEYSAWGYAVWKKKNLEARALFNREYLENILKSAEALITIYRAEPRLINTLIYNYKSHQTYGDTLRVASQYLNKTYSVFPKKSLVRNHGFDGSGTTINKKIVNYTNQPIDDSTVFEMKKLPIQLNEKIMKEVQRSFRRPRWMNMAIFFRMFWHKWTGKDIFYYYDIKRHNGCTKLT